MVKEVVSPPYIIDEQVLKRFDQRMTVFERMRNDKDAPFFGHGMYDRSLEVIARGEDGYSLVDFGRMLGAWTVYDYFHGAFSFKKLQDDRSVMVKPVLSRLVVDNVGTITNIIKDIAQFYGSSLVGISRIDQRWLYSHNQKGEEIEIGDDFKFAVVMAIAMDPERIRRSPDFVASAESALGYSRMAFSVACLAEFIRYLGYQAIPMGNDIALSIPMAIDAELGELGRNGLLITHQFGPCVRICKVFTDLPLRPDQPIEFGVKSFCEGCRKCVEACEVEAISDAKKPSYDIACASNSRGILRWAVDHERCYQFWIENGTDCSSCIAACPFTKG
ncbi:MAG TPA: reductive dehalogenase [bacterium (Candidatus Stahlbacteria)]|nr:reductive dehalogenase [Candidatus Stahlbacteria bacterium]